MTDRQTTASDVAATIDQIEQALAESADVGQLTMNGIEHLLGGMYQKAEAASDQQAMQVINDTWGSIQSLAQHSQHNREAALTMTEIAATMRNQRDNVIKDLETLTKAVENMDNDHPLVGDLIEAVEEGVNEWYGIYGEDASSEAAWEKRQEYRFALKKHSGCAADAVDSFLDMLEGETNPSQQQIDIMKTLLDTFAVKATDEEGDDDE